MVNQPPDEGYLSRTTIGSEGPLFSFFALRTFHAVLPIW